MEFQIPLSREDLLQREGNRYTVEECCTSEELVTRLEGAHTHKHINNIYNYVVVLDNHYISTCNLLVMDGGSEFGVPECGGPQLIDCPPLPFFSTECRSLLDNGRIQSMSECFPVFFSLMR